MEKHEQLSRLGDENMSFQNCFSTFWKLLCFSVSFKMIAVNIQT